MKKILITGSSGFIGSFLVEEALNRGYEVHAGIRTSSSKKYLADKRIKFLDLDFSHKENLKKIFSDFRNENGKFDFVIHNAGVTKAKTKEDFFTVNYHYTKNLVQALQASNCTPEKFIYVSSLAAVGPGSGTLPISQLDIPHPITSYGKSKLSSEKFLFSLNDFPFIIIRPTAVYGPRDREFFVLIKLINGNIEPYLSFREQLVSFIYVHDLTRVIFDSAESPFYNRAYFISDGSSYTTKSFNEIAKQHLHKKTIRIVIPSALIKPLAYTLEKVAEVFGKVATFNRERAKEFEAANWLCDTNAIKNDLKFRPRFTLESGLRETVKWYKEEGWLT